MLGRQVGASGLILLDIDRMWQNAKSYCFWFLPCFRRSNQETFRSLDPAYSRWVSTANLRCPACTHGLHDASLLYLWWPCCILFASLGRLLVFGTCAWYVPCGWDAGLSAVLPCSILIFDCMSSGLLIALQLIFVLFAGFSLSCAMCWIIVFCLGVLGCLLELPKDKPCMLCGQLAAKELFCSRSTKGCCPQRLQKTPYGHVHTCIGVCTHIYMIPHNMIKPCRNAQLEEDQCDETRPRRQLR